MQCQALCYTPVTDNEHIRIITNGLVHRSLKPPAANGSVQVEQFSDVFSDAVRLEQWLRKFIVPHWLSTINLDSIEQVRLYSMFDEHIVDNRS